MKSKLLIECVSDNKPDELEANKRFWSFVAEFLLLLADGNWRIIGHDFTPPPFREKLENYFRANGVKYLGHSDGVSFEFTSQAQIAGCAQLINWACALVVRLEQKNLNEVEVPQMKKRLMMRTPDAWYEEHEGEFPALCYLGISPNPAIDVRVSAFTHEELLDVCTKALRSTGLAMQQMQTKAVVAPVINMTITSVNRLGDLLNLVRDRWFDAERIALDKERKVVVIHLEEKTANLAKGSKDGISLVINNAEELAVNDTEKVRDYDLNEIKFDAASGRLIITGGIPITIEVKVTALNIEAVNAAT